MSESLQPTDGTAGVVTAAAMDRTDAAAPSFVRRPAPSNTARWKATPCSLVNWDFRYLWLGMMAMMGGEQM